MPFVIGSMVSLSKFPEKDGPKATSRNGRYIGKKVKIFIIVRLISFL